jgi:bifunctional lysine-specific demethylase and histidyl-hydroxylase NO66
MTGALERCVGDVGRFAEEHWGRKPLYRPGADPAGFAGLLDLRDVDHLVTETLLRMPSFRLVKEGKPLDPKGYTQTIRIGSKPVERTIRPDRVLAAFDDGATIVLQALHRQWPAVARFCRDLELVLTHPVQANAYVTPATSQGFAVHHDTHDVFVLQTHGHKRWRVYEPVVERPGKEQPWSRSRTDPGEPILEAELSPGDCLYLPRGFPHDAVAREEVSIHITVGIPATTWVDVWRQVLADLPEHVPFREALPIGFAEDPTALAEEMAVRVKELQAFVEDRAGQEAAASFAGRFWRTRRPELAGQMGQLERLRTLGPEDLLRRRERAVFRVSPVAGEVRVLLGRRELRMPAGCEPAVRFVAAAPGTFRPTDLPGLDPNSRLVLARRLIREGAVELVDASR